MSRIKQIQALVRNGLYYLTEHADNEALEEGFDIYDVEYAILTGKIRRSWPKEGKYEIVGSAFGWMPSWDCLSYHSNYKGSGYHCL